MADFNNNNNNYFTNEINPFILSGMIRSISFLTRRGQYIELCVDIKKTMEHVGMNFGDSVITLKGSLHGISTFIGITNSKISEIDMNKDGKYSGIESKNDTYMPWFLVKGESGASYWDDYDYESSNFNVIRTYTPIKIQEPNNHVINMYKSLVNDKEYSDIKFSVDGKIINAHRVILYRNPECDYFRSLIDSGFEESKSHVIEIDDIPYDIFIQIITYLYTGAIDNFDNSQFTLSLLNWSNFMGITSLFLTCIHYLDKYVDMVSKIAPTDSNLKLFNGFRFSSTKEMIDNVDEIGVDLSQYLTEHENPRELAIKNLMTKCFDFNSQLSLI